MLMWVPALDLGLAKISMNIVPPKTAGIFKNLFRDGSPGSSAASHDNDANCASDEPLILMKMTRHKKEQFYKPAKDGSGAVTPVGQFAAIP